MRPRFELIRCRVRNSQLSIFNSVIFLERMTTPSQSLSQITAGGFRWSLLPGLKSKLVSNDGLLLPSWLESGAARVVKQGPHRIVYRVELPGLCFYIKHNFVH